MCEFRVSGWSLGGHRGMLAGRAVWEGGDSVCGRMVKVGVYMMVKSWRVCESMYMGGGGGSEVCVWRLVYR